LKVKLLNRRWLLCALGGSVVTHVLAHAVLPRVISHHWASSQKLETPRSQSSSAGTKRQPMFRRNTYVIPETAWN
jgi:hypothetical protein